MKGNKWLLGLTIVPASLALAPPLWSQIGSETGKPQSEMGRPQTEAGKAGADAAVQGQTGARQSGQVTPPSSAGMAASSDEIKKLQQALKDKGQEPGAINGVMTPQTQSALKAFQNKQRVS